jgi:hypothetical protein
LEQLEVALFEGAWERVVWAATGRIIERWHLDSEVKRHQDFPDSFWIPSDEEKEAIRPGDRVKLLFELRDGWGERMWVDVIAVRRGHLVGTLLVSLLVSQDSAQGT